MPAPKVIASPARKVHIPSLPRFPGVTDASSWSAITAPCSWVSAAAASLIATILFQASGYSQYVFAISYFLLLSFCNGRRICFAIGASRSPIHVVSDSADRRERDIWRRQHEEHAGVEGVTGMIARRQSTHRACTCNSRRQRHEHPGDHRNCRFYFHHE